MAFYKVCEYCGCNLDPGERCDCIDEREHKNKLLRKLIVQGDDNQLKMNMEELSYEKEAC